MQKMVLQYHHCRSLESVIYDKVQARPEHTDEYFKMAYLWLEKEVGFYPLFLAVGRTEEDIRMTGYQNQWRRVLSEGPGGKEYRKKGKFPSEVLFSFGEVEGVFMDYDYWHLVLGANYKNYSVTNYEKKLIFKPSWSKSRWLRKARENPHSVQLVTSELYLPEASRVWARNKLTQQLLISNGFKQVEVKRLFLEDWEKVR